jgi:dihydroorotate dehydrogenase electron transfer subunit
VRAQIAFNREVSAAYRHLGFVAPGFPRSFVPGQFVMVRSPFGADPFLPRAFSIYRSVPATDSAAAVVEILYKVLGKGTQCLSRMERGQEIELLGPLGNSFTLREGVDVAVLVAGGIGVPPIAALARQIRIPQSTLRKCEVFLGGKTSEDILCVKDFEAAGAKLHITTEDGSLGTRALITDLLGPFLESVGDRAIWQSGNQEGPNRPIAQSPNRLCIFTCGPPGMLAAVARLAEARGVPCQTSVEANMACGFGACMGCATEVRSSGSEPSYKLVCKDGPVFESRELVWR